MSRYLGPKLKINRKLGELPGLTKKKSKKINYLEKNKNLNNINKRISEYSIRLKEKQKLKYNYGLTENQLFRYVKEARRIKGITGFILLQLIEMRLDNICYRLGFAKTIPQARQLVNHGQFLVNNSLINIPSYQCQLGDLISVNDPHLIEKLPPIIKKNTPSHLEFDRFKFQATLIDYCDRSEIGLEINELLVIEYYSQQ